MRAEPIVCACQRLLRLCRKRVPSTDCALCEFAQGRLRMLYCRLTRCDRHRVDIAEALLILDHLVDVLDGESVNVSIHPLLPPYFLVRSAQRRSTMSSAKYVYQYFCVSLSCARWSRKSSNT